MAYTLSNMCAKNLCKWTLLVQVIIKNVVTFFGTQCIYTVISERIHVIIFLCLQKTWPFFLYMPHREALFKSINLVFVCALTIT